MAFSQSTITAGPLFTRRGAELVVTWTSSAPAGSCFQLYAGTRLAWSGVARLAVLPAPTAPVLYRVGTVDPSEATTDLSATLPAPGGGGGGGPVSATLTWAGGTYLGDDLAGFRVYGESTPGGGIDYGTPLGTVAAYARGQLTDGWGQGGWGGGGWGRAAGSYSWASGPLAGGTWHFGVRPFDAAGNEGTASAAAVAIDAAPRPPAARLATLGGRAPTYEYDPGTGIATLSWLASPG